MAGQVLDPEAEPESSMEDLLAAARYGIPEPADGHVRRPRLVQALADAADVPLVLVSAPAGTGKTSLVAEWLRSDRRPSGLVGWVSFEPDDGAFWGPVTDCLHRLGLDVAARGAALAETPMGRKELSTLAGAVAERPDPVTLVVDGHELVSREVAQEVDFLLRHTFGRLRLVMVGRVDPVLPLYRYRLADRLREVRVGDLAFTDDEAGKLLKGLGASLSVVAVHDLNERTKGWAAGLRFAARLLAGCRDPEASAATVVAQAGDINEYLVGEVLDTQPPDVRRLLLRTCVPDVLWPELADDLAGPGAGRALGELTRSNAFIEPVPDRPGAYRYYPFFRDLLRARLAYEEPRTMVDLQRRTARFLLRCGLADQSLGHLAAIGAWDEVARHLVEGDLLGRLLVEPPDGPLRRVAGRLSGDLEQPEACAVRAAAAMAAGDAATCGHEIARARSAAGERRATYDALTGTLVVLDALRGRFAADADSAMDLALEAERATRTLPGVAVTPVPGLVALAVGVARLRRGELVGARGSLTSALTCDPATASAAFRAECLGYLAVVDALDGRLRRARDTASQSLAVAAVAGLGDPPVAHVAAARVAVDQYELTEARAHVDSALACRTPATDPVTRSLAEGVVAALDRADGRAQSALDRLESTAVEAARTDPWLGRCLSLEAARLSIAAGEPDRALSTLAPLSGEADPEVAVVRAAACAEQGDSAAVRSSLAAVRAGDASLRARVSELLIEGACESEHRAPLRGRDLLGRSLRLARAEGLRLPFREAGPSVQRALAANRGLLAANRWLDQPAEVPRPRAAPGELRAPLDGETEVYEPLTAREMEVLRHLEELLTTEEIAEKMFVSVNTVRTHVRSILRKLGVSRRNAAVRKARRLGMVED